MKMLNEKFDVVVIGAGLGGLSAAGHLAKKGKSVLVLEHHTIPGGYAHEFRRGQYRFEVALHAINGVTPGESTYEVLTDLDVLSQVNFKRMDPFYTVQFPDLKITAHADIFKYEAELIRHFPHEADGIRRLITKMITTYYELRRFTMDGELGRRPSMGQMPTTYPDMMSAMSQSWGNFLNQFIDDEKLQGVISTLWGYFGLPPSRLNAATFILPWVSFHLFGAYYPEGGSMSMSRAIEKTIKNNGGEIRYKQDVNHIEIDNNRAVSVTTDKGLYIEADIIISNANPYDTMLNFVGKTKLPSKYVQKIKTDKPALSNLILYMGLSQDLLAEGWNHHELFINNTYDMEADYSSIKNGDFKNAGLLISHYNKVDPTCSPSGGSILVAMTLAPWDYSNQWGTEGNMDNYRKNSTYLETKEKAGEIILSRMEKIIPNLRDNIKYMEIATPLTNKRYTLNPKGSIYGSEQSVENMYMGRLSEKTPIDNLFLTGAWGTAGGGMGAALISGRNVARKALQ